MVQKNKEKRYHECPRRYPVPVPHFLRCRLFIMNDLIVVAKVDKKLISSISPNRKVTHLYLLLNLCVYYRAYWVGLRKEDRSPSSSLWESTFARPSPHLTPRTPAVLPLYIFPPFAYLSPTGFVITSSKHEPVVCIASSAEERDKLVKDINTAKNALCEAYTKSEVCFFFFCSFLHF